DAELLVNVIDLMMGGGSTNIYIDVIGDNPAELTEMSEKLVAAIQTIDGVLKVESNQEEQKSVYSFHVNPVQAKGQEVAMQLHSLLNPLPIGSIRIENNETPVLLQPVINPESEADLKQVVIMTESGPTPIAEVAQLVRTEESSLYYHKDGKPYVRV